MSIIRKGKNKENPYVMASKVWVNDDRLSLQARGLMIYILSKPDDWQIYEKELLKHMPNGKDSLSSTMKELIQFGYIEREKIRDLKGTFRGYEYTIYEENIQSGKSDFGLSDNGQSATTNNNQTDNDLTEYKKDDGILSGDKNTVSFSYKNLDVIKAMKLYMNDLYRQKTKRKHPFLKPEQYHAVYESLTAFCEEWGTEYQGLADMMCKFLNTKTIQSDWNINHFATEGIMLNRMYEVAY
jgi:hypothetical protein